jgi:hypothetical protein
MQIVSKRSIFPGAIISHPNSSFNSDCELLIQPNLNGRALLKELEDEIDGREKNFAPAASTTSVHLEFE